MIYIRSTLFNLLFFGSTAILAIIGLPFLLGSRDGCLRLARFWLSLTYFYERTVLGLDFMIEGREYLPPRGPYIIAAKHQSAWETLKLLHLFGEPLIILKKELIDIPLWGRFAMKYGVIPVDRSKGSEAVKEMLKNAKEAIKTGRPIVIFPQGTRVGPKESKRYKSGVSHLYKSLNIPIGPISLNSGFFWPRNSFLKKKGQITVRIHEPINPGQTRETMMEALKERIETGSRELYQKAKTQHDPIKAQAPSKQVRPLRLGIYFLLTLAIIYTGYWFFMSYQIQSNIKTGLSQIKKEHQIDPHFTAMKVTGFPTEFNIKIANLSLQSLKKGDEKKGDEKKENEIFIPEVKINLPYHLQNRAELTLPQGFRSLMTREDGALITAKTGKLRLYLKPLEFLRVKNINIAGDLSKTSTELSDTEILFDLFNLEMEIYPMPVSIPDSFNQDTLEEWRDNKGEIILHDLSLSHRGVTTGVEISAELNEKLQPVIAGEFTLRGDRSAIQQELSTLGLKPVHLELLKSIVKSKTQTNKTETSRSANEIIMAVPIAVRDRFLFIGPLPVLHLPELNYNYLNVFKTGGLKE